MRTKLASKVTIKAVKISSRQPARRPLGPMNMPRCEELAGGVALATGGVAVVISSRTRFMLAFSSPSNFPIRLTGELQPEQRPCERHDLAVESRNRGSTCPPGEPYAGIADSWDSICNCTGGRN